MKIVSSSLLSVVALLVCTVNLAIGQPGKPDPTFGTNGVATGNIGSYDDAAKVLALPNGKIMLFGYSEDATDRYISILRFNANGTLDNTFNTNGSRKHTVANSSGIAIGDFELTADGGMVACGNIRRPGTSSGDWAIFKFDSLGNFDNNFGTNGILRYPCPNKDCELLEMLIQNDGKIVAAGRVDSSATRDVLTLRINADGTLDNSFGNGGITTLDFVSNEDRATTIALQADGKIVVAGWTETFVTGFDLFVARYNSNGTLDNTFSSSGKTTFDIGDEDNQAHSIGIQSDGKIVVGGWAYGTNNRDFTLVRFNANGTVDNTYGNNGIFRYDINGAWQEGSKLVIQPNGKVIMAGQFRSGFNVNVGTVRVLTNGSIDPTFGTNGATTVAFGTDLAWISGISLQSDGKILIACDADNGNTLDFKIIRLNAGDPTVGISDVENGINHLSVYPNPVSGSGCVVSFSLETADEVQFSLIDLLGQTISLSMEAYNRGPQTVKINLPEGLATGTYMLRLQASGIQKTVKVLIW